MPTPVKMKRHAKAAAKKPQMPLGGEQEISYTQSGIYSKTIQQYNPDDLVGKKGLQIYRKMMLDDQVKAAVSAKQYAVLSTGYEIVPPEVDEESDEREIAQEMTDFVKFDLEDIEGSFDSRLYDIMTAMQYGFSVTERIHRVVEGGRWAGKVALKALKTRQPFSFDFVTDEHGNLLENGVQQDRRSMPADKFVIYCLHGDTIIHSPSGDTPIRELVGKTPWLYSWSDGALGLTQARKVWKTGYAECVKVRYKWKRGREVFENSIVCTPEHQFMMFDGSYQKANNLKPGDSLRPFEQRPPGKATYWSIKRNDEPWPNGWQSRHRWVWEQFNETRIPQGYFIHHRDRDKNNDSPENLILKSAADHMRDHATEYWAGIPLEARREHGKRMKKGFYAALNDPSRREMICKNMSVSAQRRTEEFSQRSKELWADDTHRLKMSEFKKAWWKKADRAAISVKMKAAWTSERKRNLSESMRRIWKQRSELNHEVVSVESYGSADVYDIEVPLIHNFAANNLIVHNSHRKTFDNFYGDSDLRAAYEPYWRKSLTNRFKMITLERYGEPLMVFTHTQTLNQANRDLLQSFGQNLQNRSVLILPQFITLDLKQGDPKIASAFMPVIQEENVAIRIALLMPGLIGLSGEQAIGSFARAVKEFDAFVWVIETERNELETLINERIVKPDVDLNYEVGDGKYPVFKFKEITAEHRENLFNLWLKAVQTGAFTKTREDENKGRELIEFPKLPDDVPMTGIKPQGGQQIDPLTGLPVEPGGGAASFFPFGKDSKKKYHLPGQHDQCTHSLTGECSREDVSAKESLSKYAAVGGQKLNEVIRSGGKMSKDFQNTKAGLDKLLSTARLPKDKPLYRGLTLDDKTARKLLDSKVFSDKGFMSTSSSKQVVMKSFVRNKDYLEPGQHTFLIEMTARKGSRAVNIDGFFPPKGGYSEREFLFPRSTQLKISSIKSKVISLGNRGTAMFHLITAVSSS